MSKFEYSYLYSDNIDYIEVMVSFWEENFRSVVDNLLECDSVVGGFKP